MKTLAALALAFFASLLPAQGPPISWTFTEDLTMPACPLPTGYPHFLPDASATSACWWLPCAQTAPIVSVGTAALVWEGFVPGQLVLMAMGAQTPAPWFPCVTAYADVVLLGVADVTGMAAITFPLPTRAYPGMPWGITRVGWGQAAQLDFTPPTATIYSSFAFSIDMRI